MILTPGRRLLVVVAHDCVDQQGVPTTRSLYSEVANSKANLEH